MRCLVSWSVLTISLFIFTCGEPGNTVDSGTTTADTTSTIVHDSGAGPHPDTIVASSNTEETRAPQQLMDCEIRDKFFEKNILRIDDIAQMLSIRADPSTYDANLGDSHRILEVWNTSDCSEILKQTLPVNRSADFPYYVVRASYEPSNKIVAIQGFENFYFYDTEGQKLSPALIPDYAEEVEAADAQSGMIKGLTIWGHYLLGYAVDFGPFAFDIQDKSKPTPVLPAAKYNIRNTTEYRSLFLLDGGNDRLQAIIPNSDIDAGGNTFDLRKLLPQALDVDTNIPKNVKNNRYIVLLDKTDGQGKRVVIDMFDQRLVDLPADVASKKTSEILEWLKSNIN